MWYLLVGETLSQKVNAVVFCGFNLIKKLDTILKLEDIWMFLMKNRQLEFCSLNTTIPWVQARVCIIDATAPLVLI